MDKWFRPLGFEIHPHDFVAELLALAAIGPRRDARPIRLGNHRKQQRTADPAKKAARKRQKAARAKNRKK